VRLEKHKNLTSSTKPKKVISSKNEEIVNKLTKREREIIKYFCKGLSCKQISKELIISFHTVDSHRKNIEKKLNVNSISSVVHFAHENNLQ
jgi:DNA-binding NarL/FixJ family response regulator